MNEFQRPRNVPKAIVQRVTTLAERIRTFARTFEGRYTTRLCVTANLNNLISVYQRPYSVYRTTVRRPLNECNFAATFA